MKYAHEINEQLTEARFNLADLEGRMKEYGDVVDNGTWARWCVARENWKDTTHQLEMELKDAEFRMFSCFLEKNKGRS